MAPRCSVDMIDGVEQRAEGFHDAAALFERVIPRAMLAESS